MSDSNLTEKQTSEIKLAIEQWRENNNAIGDLGLPDRDKFIKQLELAKSFLDQHKDVAFHYHCSGRGLPARFYLSKIEILRLYESGHEDYEHLVNNDYLAKIEVNIKRYQKSIERFTDSQEQREIKETYERGTPVFIASVHRKHGYNISLHKHTIATVLSGDNDRYFVKFKNGATAFIKGVYLIKACKDKHAQYTGWNQHKQIVDEVKKSELVEADKSLKELCEKHNVLLSVTNGQIVLVDGNDLDNELVINEQSHV